MLTLSPPVAAAAFDAHTGGELSASPPPEHDLLILNELIEIGMDVARAIGRQAKAETAEDNAPPPAMGAIAAAYDRVARAVRLGIMLKARLAQDAAAQGAAATRETSGAGALADRARLDLEDERKARVERIVERVAQAQHGDKAAAERLAEEAAERLDQDDIYGDVLSRPVSELIAAICRDLDLSPDWPRLAREAWAREEIAGGAPGSPLAALAVGDPHPPAARPLTAADPFGLSPHAASP